MLARASTVMKLKVDLLEMNLEARASMIKLKKDPALLSAKQLKEDPGFRRQSLDKRGHFRKVVNEAFKLDEGLRTSRKRELVVACMNVHTGYKGSRLYARTMQVNIGPQYNAVIDKAGLRKETNHSKSLGRSRSFSWDIKDFQEKEIEIKENGKKRVIENPVYTVLKRILAMPLFRQRAILKILSKDRVEIEYKKEQAEFEKHILGVDSVIKKVHGRTYGLFTRMKKSLLPSGKRLRIVDLKACNPLIWICKMCEGQELEKALAAYRNEGFYEFLAEKMGEDIKKVKKDLNTAFNYEGRHMTKAWKCLTKEFPKAAAKFEELARAMSRKASKRNAQIQKEYETAIAGGLKPKKPKMLNGGSLLTIEFFQSEEHDIMEEASEELDRRKIPHARIHDAIITQGDEHAEIVEELILQFSKSSLGTEAKIGTSYIN